MISLYDGGVYLVNGCQPYFLQQKNKHMSSH